MFVMQIIDLPGEYRREADQFWEREGKGTEEVKPVELLPNPSAIERKFRLPNLDSNVDSPGVDLTTYLTLTLLGYTTT